MGIETFLTSQEAVQDATVEYDAERLTIEHAPTLDVESLWEHIEGMGYEIDELASASEVQDG